MIGNLVRRLLAAGLLVGFAMPATAAEREPVRIGAFLATSGDAEFLGEPEAKTLRLWSTG